MASFVPWAAGGSGFILLSVGMLLTFRQIKNLLAENRICRRQNGILFRVILENRLMIPDEYWGEARQAASEPLPDVPKKGMSRGNGS